MGTTDITLDRAYLAAIWLETLFYGMNVVLFFSCLFILTIRRRTPHVNKMLVTIALLMFTFSTCHVFLGFYRLIMGFIVLRDQPGGPAAFFSDVSIPANVAKVGIHTVNSIVGDSVVVWRCYLVWGRDWKMCAAPIILVIGSAICGFGQTVYFARGQQYHSAFAHPLVVWNGSLFSLSLTTNVVVTCLVGLRVWCVFSCFTTASCKDHETIYVRFILRMCGGTVNFRYWRILLIVIESGMIYSVALICEVTLYFLGLNSFYIVYDPIGQLTGIVPTMILVLAGLELTTNDVHSRLTGTQLSTARFRTRPLKTTDESGTLPLDTIQFASVSSCVRERKSTLPAAVLDDSDVEPDMPTKVPLRSERKTLDA
ncbi:uncharacterized protein LAESUDRAFT_641340 [Laetiporus sulphureus 93-53]|uniref:Integral membrane protein n=1 Tax=Laetiporus sulphureus 93-53 TaxID=1314785 RepID=A0A165HKG4_9APHY|nr:uncharacterized protein LAESUDRAFT_641340 [Laetiporus sulphureus 93-53]KZT11847.1 hypothetical protein LAESUDRAFT_641340 [Laetiporus sulphureus 93-53]